MHDTSCPAQARDARCRRVPRVPRGPERRGGIRREQHGAVAPEYVGVLVVAALIIAAITTAPIAGLVAEWAGYAVCEMFGDDCARPVSPDAAVPAARVSMVCLETSEREALGGSATVFSVKVSGDLAYQIDRSSDGRHDVTLEMSGGLAAELIWGGKLSVDGLGVRQGRQGAVEVGADATVSPVFTFDSQEAAVAFAEQARELVTGPVDDLFDWRTAIPVYGQARISVNQLRRIRDFEAPSPSGLKIEGSVTALASGDAYGNSFGGSGVLSAGRTLGADIDLETGDTTYFVALDAAVAADLGLGPRMVPAGGGISASGEVAGEVTVALTVDADRQPTTLAFGTTVEAHGGLDGAFDGLLFAGSPFGAVRPDLEQAVAALDVQAREQHSGALSATATLDLRDPDVQALGRDVMRALGSRDRDQLADEGRRLVGYLADDAPLEAQYHYGERSQFDVEAARGNGLAFGLGVSHEDAALQLGGAWMRPEGGRFQRGYCS